MYINLILFGFVVTLLINMAAMIFDGETFSIYNLPKWDLFALVKSVSYYILFLLIMMCTYYLLSMTYRLRTKAGRLNRSNFGYVIFLYMMVAYIALQFYFAYQYGFIKFIIDSRFNVIPIGGLNYIVLIASPIAIIQYLNSKGSIRVASIFFTLVSIYSALTGYRLLIIWGVAVLGIYYLSKLKILFSFRKKVLAIIFAFVVFFLYEYIREAMEGSLLSFNEKGIFFSLSRSNPISNMILFDQLNLDHKFFVIFEVLLLPFEELQYFFSGIRLFNFAGQNLNFIYSLISGFLIGRGTFDAEATGISIHAITYFYMIGGLLFLIFMAFCFGILVFLGCFFCRAQGVNLRIFGALILVFVLSCNESFEVGWGLFFYSALYLIVSFLICSIMNVCFYSKRCQEPSATPDSLNCELAT